MLTHPRSSVLSALYDGEIAPAAAAALEQHLESCEPCSGEYRRLGELANAVRHLPRMSAPQNLAVRVREQFDAEERGMVPVLRGHVLRTGNSSGFFPALSLGTLATLVLLGLVVVLDQMYGVHAARTISSALIPTTLPEPVLFHEPMSSPRFRDASVNSLPFADVERGKEGTMLTLASIDQNGTVRALEVIYRSGDEQMLARTLEALRVAGFEPARLGGHTVAVNFLHLFTTTEVRSHPGRRSRIETGRNPFRARLEWGKLAPRAI
ncbi:MAG TPA: zf-HC2 domain-containing protein [Vicinamibacteria bacterium]|nr:zf-HC2 domain-containing protein [Vicinamibacteria bacterium]